MGVPKKKSTDPKLEVVLESIRFGLSIKDGCRRAHISREWFYEKQKISPEFAKQVDDAYMAFKLRNLAIIQKAASRSWTAAAWLLERKIPEEFSLRREITGPRGGPIPVDAVPTSKIDFSKMTTVDLKKLIITLQEKDKPKT